MFTELDIGRMLRVVRLKREEPVAKAKPKPSSQPNAPTDKSAIVRVSIVPSDELGYHYVNHAEVGHSQHEFYMLWGRLPTKLSPNSVETAAQSGSLPIVPTVQLQFPATLIGGVIHALTEQRARYEKQFGPIKDTWKKPDKKP